MDPSSMNYLDLFHLWLYASFFTLGLFTRSFWQ
jgi:hypothetical protein